MLIRYEYPENGFVFGGYTKTKKRDIQDRCKPKPTAWICSLSRVLYHT